MQKCFFLLFLATRVSAYFYPKLSKSAHCPSFEPVPFLNLTNYVGLWYEIQKFPAPGEGGMRCVYTTYTMKTYDSGQSYLRFNNSGERGSSRDWVAGNMTEKNPPEGAFYVTFDGVPAPPPKTPNYNILEVDTSSYVLIYSCKEIPKLGYAENCWILGRQSSLPDDVIDMLKSKLTEIGSDPSKLTVTGQTGCGY